MAKWIVLAIVAVVALAALLGDCSKIESQTTVDDCLPFAQVLSAEAWARELGQSEAWVRSNHRDVDFGFRYWIGRQEQSRHTAATLLLRQGVHPKIVQERLGHADISTTMDTYSHVLPSMQREAADRLEELFAKA